MLKSNYTLYLWIYINICCICKKKSSKPFKIWSAIIKINTKGTALIMKLDPGVNLENDEIKGVLVMLVASYFLNKVTCTRNILETYLGDMYL